MRGHDEYRIDRCRGSSPEDGLPVGGPAPATVASGRLGRLAARIATCSAGLLLLAAMMLTAPAVSSAQVAVGVSVTFAPPALPVYVQPPCPAPGYIWTPGYWAWDPVIGYYWVPGTWVLAPFPGALWTPGYWAWSDGAFVWYAGYWGPVVGFYGGINYGFGYTGYGYEGGYWSGGAFFYNRSVNNVTVTNITNVYTRTVTNVTSTRVSYNGGRGGTTLRPTAAQLDAGRQRRSSLIGVQREQERAARLEPRQRAAVNRGRPDVAATPKPGTLIGHGVVRASRAGEPYKAPPSHAAPPGAPARTSPPAGVERRPPPRYEAPPRGRYEAPPHAPRNEPARHGQPRPHEAPPQAAPRHAPQHPGEAAQPAPRHPAPERPGASRPPSAPHAAPQRPETPPPPKEGPRREEGAPR